MGLQREKVAGFISQQACTVILTETFFWEITWQRAECQVKLFPFHPSSNNQAEAWLCWPLEHQKPLREVATEKHSGRSRAA